MSVALPLLDIKGLKAGYREVEVLHGIDLSVPCSTSTSRYPACNPLMSRSGRATLICALPLIGRDRLQRPEDRSPPAREVHRPAAYRNSAPGCDRRSS